MNAADAIIVLDNEMSSVRSEIMDAQISFQIQANICLLYTSRCV